MTSGTGRPDTFPETWQVKDGGGDIHSDGPSKEV